MSIHVQNLEPLKSNGDAKRCPHRVTRTGCVQHRPIQFNLSWEHSREIIKQLVVLLIRKLTFHNAVAWIWYASNVAIRYQNPNGSQQTQNTELLTHINLELLGRRLLQCQPGSCLLRGPHRTRHVIGKLALSVANQILSPCLSCLATAHRIVPFSNNRVGKFVDLTVPTKTWLEDFITVANTRWWNFLSPFPFNP
jgi:hypothetical protein